MGLPPGPDREAVERVLGLRRELLPGAPGPSPRESAALLLALALSRRDDGSGDILGCEVPAPAALLLLGAGKEEVISPFPERLRPAPPARSCLRRGFLGSPASPGTLVQVLAGAALAFRLRGEPRVGLCVLDRSALSTSAWHEGFNLAAVQRVPLVVAVLRSPALSPDPVRELPPVTRMGAAYGVRAATLDGACPLTLLDPARKEVESVRRDGGVRLLEILLPGTGSDPVPHRSL